MKLFKPYLYLIKSETTGDYTLNSVVSLPDDYVLNSIEQAETMWKDKKVWGVTAKITTNGSTDTKIAEFSVPLEQGPTPEIKKVRMIINSSSSSMTMDEEDEGTSSGYDDFD